MTLLAKPTEVSQKDGEVGDWEHCGEAVTASVCDDAGQPRPVVDVVNWLRILGENPDNGTPPQWIVQYLIAHGIPAHTVDGDPAIDAALARSHRLVWLVWSDGRGNVNGSRHTRHWVQVYGHDAANVAVQNPLGDPTFGAVQTIPAGTFFANSCGTGIEIDLVLLADQGDDVMNLQTKRAFVRLAFASMLERQPQDQAAEDTWAGQIKDDASNVDDVLAAIAMTPEAQAVAKQRANPADTASLAAAVAKLQAEMAAIAKAAG